MRAITCTALLMIGTSALVARGSAAAPPPATAPPAECAAAANETTFEVGDVQPGGAGGGGGGSFVVFARDALTPTKSAYLGVNTSAAAPALQKQLQLKPGVGLVVDGVEPGSPAEKAGVKEFDILHKLDDQLLINAEQLGVLIRNTGAGKDIKLTVIREGKPQVIDAKLGERDVPPMRLTLSRQTQAALLPDGHPPVLDFVDANAQVNDDPVAYGTIHINTPDGKHQLSAACVTIESDQHRMTIRSLDGRKQLKVEDKSGKVLFEGPISTKEELDKVPADLRQAYTDVLLDYSADVKAAPLPNDAAPAKP